MPFESKRQWRAAFAGALGSEMKAKAKTWAKHTPGGYSSLPSTAKKKPSAPVRPKR